MKESFTDQPIDLTPSGSNEEQFDLTPQAPQEDAVVANERAKKYDFALGPLSPGHETLKFSIVQGQDSAIRTQAAIQEQIKSKDVRNQLAKDYMLRPGEKTPEDLEMIYSLTNDQAHAEAVNPTSILERKYADNVVTSAMSAKPSKAVEEANVDSAADAYNGASTIIARKELAQKIGEGLENRRRSMAWAPYALDLAENFVPGFSWYNQTNNIKGGGSNFWLGENLQAQAYAYYSEPDDAKAQLMLWEAAENIAKYNLHDAINYVNFITSSSRGDVILNNLVVAGDVATAAGWGLAAKGTQMAVRAGSSLPRALASNFAPLTTKAVTAVKGAGKTSEEVVVEAAKQVVKATSNRTTTPEAVLEAAGAVDQSGLRLAIQKMEDRASGVRSPTAVKQLRGELSSLSSPEDIINGGGNPVSVERQLRVQKMLTQNATGLVEGTFNTPVNISRMPAGSVTERAAMDETYRLWSRQYDQLSHAVLNLTPRYQDAEEAAMAAIRVKMDDSQAKYMQGLSNTESKYRDGTTRLQDYNDWLFARSDFYKSKQAFEEITGKTLPIASRVESPAFGMMKAAKGGLKENPASWNKLLKAIDNAQAASADVDPAMLDGLKKRLSENLAKLRNFDPKDRREFSGRFQADETLKTLPPAKPATPSLGLAKDELGNTKYLAVRLGASGKGDVSAKEFYQKLDPQVQYTLGHAQEAVPFDSIEQAELWAKHVYGLQHYGIGQQGTQFVIEAYKAIDETAPTVRHALAVETRNQGPKFNMGWFTRFYSADTIVGSELSTARKQVAYGGSNMRAMVAKAFDPINAVARDERKDLARVLEMQRTDGPGELGMWSNTSEELYKYWSDTIGGLPTEAQEISYFTAKQISDAEYAATNLRVHTAKTRAGYQKHTFGEVDGIKLPGLEGKFYDKVPQMDHDFGALVLEPASGEFQYMRKYGGAPYKPEDRILKQKGWKGDTPPPLNAPFLKRRVPNDVSPVSASEEINRALFNDLTDSGYKVVKLTKYAEEDLRAWAAANNMPLPSGKIDFILSKSLNSGPLDYQQIPYRGGIHHRYIAPFMVKQPEIKYGGGMSKGQQINETLYYGDRNVHGFETHAEAIQFQNSYNTARHLYHDLRAGKLSDKQFNDFVSRNLPYSGNTLRKMFDDGFFDPNVPFYVTTSGQSIDKAHNLAHTLPELKGEFKRVYDFDDGLNIDLKNVMERGGTLSSIANVGSAENPIFKIQPAKMLDALPTLERSAQEVMRGRYLEDLKFKQAEEFLAKFGDLLNEDPKLLAANPLKALYDAPWMPNPADRGRLNAAIAYRRTALEFLHMRGDIEKDVNFIKNMGMRLFGADSKTAKVLDPWLEKMTDINWVQKAKNAAFHMKMSFLNVKQFFVQAQSMATVWAAEGPVRAGKTMVAQTMTTMARIYGDTTADLARYEKAMAFAGWKKGEFQEAYQAMHRSGFANVGRERADMDDFMTAGYIMKNQTWGKILDASGWPIRQGDRLARDAAWMAAYRRWRDANPETVLNDVAIGQILNRADKLAIHPSSASNASLQHGVTGVPVQFMSYNWRLFGELWKGTGEKFTAAEKTRITVMNALLYGVGGAAGAWAFGINVPELIRKKSLEYGYDVSGSTIERIIFNGAMNEVARLAYGEDTNIGERYGPAGADVLTDFLYDKPGFAILSGAAGSSLGQLISSLSPYAYYVATSFSGSDKVYQPTTDDFMAVLSNITGFNDFHKGIIAFNTGKWMNRAGTQIDDVSKTQALLRAITGVDPQRISDLQKIKEINKYEREVQSKMEPKIRAEWQASLKAFSNDDDTEGHRRHMNAMALIIQAGYRDDERGALFNRLVRGMEDEVDRVSRRFAEKSPERLKAFMKRIQRQDQ